MDWQPVTTALTKAEARISFTRGCQRNSILDLLVEDIIRIDVYRSDSDIILNRYSTSRQFLKENHPHLLEEL